MPHIREPARSIVRQPARKAPEPKRSAAKKEESKEAAKTAKERPKQHTVVSEGKGIDVHTYRFGRHERVVQTHRFHELDQRTGEYHFDSHWWHNFFVYPNTVSRTEASRADYGIVKPPAKNNVAPPVIRAADKLPISEDGAALAAALDGMDVEHHWLPGQFVNWKTGNLADDQITGPASNCATFVAAACARLKVPMPAPELANSVAANQFDWLLDQGKESGWLAVGDVEARLLANQGWVVVAGWKNPGPASERKLSALLAIVRPDTAPLAELEKSGPKVITAGLTNRNAVPLDKAFPPDAWVKHEIIFVVHRQR
jgi:hypothetical protein